MQLDDASSKLTTFNAPFGSFRLRMPFGISSAPEEFQKRMNDSFGDIKATAVIAGDDLLVYGEGDDTETASSDHDKNLRIVLERVRERNLTLNKEKVHLRVTEVPYIGYLLGG